MTGLYVYAIAPPAALPEDLGTGIDGAAVWSVDVPEGVAAVVHRHHSGPFQGPDDQVRQWVLEHGDVVERTWDATQAVLPVSFNVIATGAEDDGDTGSPGVDGAGGPGAGSGLEGAEARLRTWLTANSVTLGDRLDALQDQTELRIEIALEVSAVAAGDPQAMAERQEMTQRPEGVQRLLRKRAEQHERQLTDTLADELYPAVRRRLAAVSADLVENRSARSEPGTVPVLTVSVLVPTDQVSTVGTELAAIAEEQPAARIRFLGPWPPYSFAEAPALGEQDEAMH